MTILGLATLPRFPSIISSSPSLFASFVPSLSHSFLLSIPLICNSFAHSSLSHVPLIVFLFEKCICGHTCSWHVCTYMRTHTHMYYVYTCMHMYMLSFKLPFVLYIRMHPYKCMHTNIRTLILCNLCVCVCVCVYGCVCTFQISVVLFHVFSVLVLPMLLGCR
jgi:hypothetical protein